MTPSLADSPVHFDEIQNLAERLREIPAESLPLDQAAGRVLRVDCVADRDSPASDVSAMDGYALRAEDASTGSELIVVGESVPGSPPPPAPQPGEVIRIFTGATVPPQCDLVVRREDVREPSASAATIRIDQEDLRPGQNIRRQGENASKGSLVVPAGSWMRASTIAAAANFGAAVVTVARPLRVRVIVTGNEVCDVSEMVKPWQLRDSNGPTLAALLAEPWLQVSCQRADDALEPLTQSIAAALETYDAILLTGGVSMGDYDYVPEATRRAGGTPVFHKLPIRPGKPIFAACGAAGQLVLGLPGNPVSAAVGAMRFARPLLACMAGALDWDQAPLKVRLDESGTRTLPLVWFRLVRQTSDAAVSSVATQGSGDLVSLAASDGFVEIPAGASGAGPWPYYRW